MRSVHAGVEWFYQGYKFFGLSLSGIRTSIAMPELEICFDVAQGYPFNLRMKKYFITHGHLDHAAGIPYIISQKAMNSEPTPQFWMPQSLVQPLTEIMHLWQKIEDHQYQFQFKGIDGSSRIELNSFYYVRPFPTVHRIESFGYTLFHRRKKLKAELQNLSQDQIKDLRRQGQTVDEVLENPVVSFTGDTQIEFLDHTPWVKNSQILILEATYLDDKKSVEHARKWGHTHLDEILPRLDDIRSERIVLIHPSSRYSPQEALALIAKRVPARHRERVILYPGQ